MQLVHLSVRPKFKPGELPPNGYLDWHEWADVQRKAGIKQVECGQCGQWKTPQELSGQHIETPMKSKRGPVIIKARICTACALAPGCGDGVGNG